MKESSNTRRCEVERRINFLHLSQSDFKLGIQYLYLFSNSQHPLHARRCTIIILVVFKMVEYFGNKLAIVNEARPHRARNLECPLGGVPMD